MSDETPSVTVIVLSWNGERFLQPCLEAVLAQNYPALELVVVDNASTDQSIALVHSHFPQVRLLQAEHNFGFAGGNNLGLRVATGEIVVLLNQDTQVRPGWLAAMVETFRDPAVGVVGCKALYPDGKTLQHAGAFIEPDTAYPHHYGQGEEDRGQYEVLRDVDYVTGAAFAFRRALLRQVGELDEGYVPAFYEEVDFCYCARRAGFRIVYQPRSVFYHHESTSLHGQSAVHALAVHRNRLRFALRHWSAGQLDVLWQAEQQTLAQSQDPPTLELLAQAYFENAAGFGAVVAQRASNPWLGGPLTPGQQRQMMEKLCALARRAGQQALQWMVPEPQDIEALPGSTQPWSDWWSTLASETFFIENPSPPSRVPIVGGLITRLRTLWFIHVLRPALAPVLGRLVLSLEYLHQHNQALYRQLEMRDAALLGVLRTAPPSAADAPKA